MSDMPDLMTELKRDSVKEQKEQLQLMAELTASKLAREKQHLLPRLVIVLYELLRQLTRKFILDMPSDFDTIAIPSGAIAGSSGLILQFFALCSDYDSFATRLHLIRIRGVHRVPIAWKSNPLSSAHHVAELIEFAKDESVHQVVWENAPHFLKLVQHVYQTDNLAQIIPSAFYIVRNSPSHTQRHD